MATPRSSVPPLAPFVKSSYRFDQAGLYQEIARSPDWRVDFSHVPKATKADIRLYQKCKPTAGEPEKKMLIGVCRDRTPVHASVHRTTGGTLNFVELRFHQGNEEQKVQVSDRVDLPELLKTAIFVEPFKRIEDVGSTFWRRAMRFFILYYFMEKDLVKDIQFTIAGLESFRRACVSIAKEPLRTGQKSVRPLLKVCKNAASSTMKETHNPERTNTNKVAKKLVPVKEQPLTEAGPVKAPENDSTRAVKTMVLQDDSIAVTLLPKGPKSSDNTYQIEHLDRQHLSQPGYVPAKVPKLPLPSELKRKRPTEEDGLKQDDPALQFRKFKQRVQQKAVELRSKEATLQEKLDTQLEALASAQNQVAEFEMLLKASISTLEKAEEETKETKAGLERVRQDMVKVQTCEQSFHILAT